MKAVILCLTGIICLNAGLASARTLNVSDDYQTIQAGINAAEDGDTVKVKDGEFIENINLNGKSIALIGNPEMPENVTINGWGRGPVVTSNHEEDARSVISGFTLINGVSQSGGGGVLVTDSSPTLDNLIICNNWGNVGGGIFIVGESSPILSRILLIDNQVATNGGAIAIWRGNAIMSDISIFGDAETPAIMGGGIYITSGSATMDRVMLANCHAGMGGAISIGSSQVSMNSVLIVGNEGENGAAISLSSSDVTLDHLTVGYNSATPGNAVVFSSSSNLTIKNSIFLADDDDRTNLMMFHHGTVDIDYCDVISGQSDIDNDQANLIWGEGNIDSDPIFVDVESGDFTISPDSPCLDAGSLESPPDPDGSRSDIGAFYLHQRDLVTDPDVIIFPISEPGRVYNVTIDIMNFGKTSLWLDVPFLEPADGLFDCIPDFREPIMLNSMGQTSVTLRYHAEEDLPPYTELLLVSNDFHEDTIRIPIAFQRRSLAVDPRNLNFPVTAPGTIDSMSVYVVNIGDEPVWVELPTIEPVNGPFSCHSDMDEPGLIDPDCGTMIQVIFERPDGGEYCGVLQIVSTSPFRDIIQVNIFAHALEVSDRTDPNSPAEFALHPAYPNPFNASTSIRFDLPKFSPVRINLLDVSGRVVTTLIDKQLQAGYHSVVLSAEGLKSGTYLIRLDTPDRRATRKITLVK